MAPLSIVVVIPAWNEARTIGEVVSQISSHFVVLVVDDCSSDNTAVEAENAGSVVIRKPANEGYEAALATGMHHAFEEHRADFVITVDADGEHDPAIIHQLAQRILKEKKPLYIGQRAKIYRRSEALVCKVVFLIYGVTDIFCGMKAYSKPLFQAYGGFDTSRCLGTELALVAIRSGFEYGEIIVGGKPRHDQPRIGNGFRLVLKLCRAVIVASLKPKLRGLSVGS